MWSNVVVPGGGSWALESVDEKIMIRSVVGVLVNRFNLLRECVGMQERNNLQTHICNPCPSPILLYITRSTTHSPFG